VTRDQRAENREQGAESREQRQRAIPEVSIAEEVLHEGENSRRTLILYHGALPRVEGGGIVGG
jgi:hypothetical protein